MTSPLAPLAEAVRFRLLAAPAGSLSRKAAGCALVVLSEAKTVKGALRMLATARLDDTIRTAATTLISELHDQHTNPKETP
ncbi:hypothetical protein [Nocardiopsis synnemataformans]|uniref:hypothetical protein n=1 Tax=Nocardiopsis synnemataformans TaxID=61305 RepID=UPI003EBE4362